MLVGTIQGIGSRTYYPLGIVPHRGHCSPTAANPGHWNPGQAGDDPGLSPHRLPGAVGRLGRPQGESSSGPRTQGSGPGSWRSAVGSGPNCSRAPWLRIAVGWFDHHRELPLPGAVQSTCSWPLEARQCPVGNGDQEENLQLPDHRQSLPAEHPLMRGGAD